jgi:hypothetical protein
MGEDSGRKLIPNHTGGKKSIPFSQAQTQSDTVRKASCLLYTIEVILLIKRGGEI